MTKQTFKINTPQGEFTRTSSTLLYTHAVVRLSSRTREAFENPRYTVGVHGRWIKDRGFAVTWHGSEQAARKAAATPYGYDHSATVLGIYPVEVR